jgi:hypothetical protein
MLVVETHRLRGRRATVRLFVCQDEDQRELFLSTADREVTGQLWHPSAPREHHAYVGRRRILFCCELDMHIGRIEASRLPGYPPNHPRRRGRDAEVRRVRLPGHPDRAEQAA